MASFENHIEQAKKNLAFIAQTNMLIPEHWDWQVTASFYVSVHLINAHLAHCADQHFRSHDQVKTAINPYSLSPCKVPEDIYLSYAKLEGLSRRSRYLCNDNLEDKSTTAFFTHDKHFSKAIKNLDKILSYISTKYQVAFGSFEIYCQDLLKSQLGFFSIRKEFRAA